MKKDKSQKKYRHGIEVKHDKKIKKVDLLRRIEALEAFIGGNPLVVKSLTVEENGVEAPNG